LVQFDWDIGRLIDERQQREGWRAAVIPRVAADLRSDMPELKGFSKRDLGRMLAFFRAYADPSAFLPQSVARIDDAGKVPRLVEKTAGVSLLLQLPWRALRILDGEDQASPVDTPAVSSWRDQKV
jgi:hypothetical protein